jgi:hypothetical protein
MGTGDPARSQADARRSHVKGQPIKFLVGHNGMARVESSFNGVTDNGELLLSEHLPYLAGYFDGEGCITVLKSGRSGHSRLQLRIALVTADFQTLSLFRATEVLRYLEPFLRTKKQQALAALQVDWGKVPTLSKDTAAEQRLSARKIISGLNSVTGYEEIEQTELLGPPKPL